jgi:hypothetical protein
MILLIIKLLLLILALSIVLSLAYVLLAPMRLFIHTENDEIGVSLGAVIKGELIWNEGEGGPIIDLRLPFLRRRIYLLSWAEFQTPNGTDSNLIRDEQKRKKSSKKQVLPLHKMLAVVKSCKVREFQLNLDTDDFCLNAQLFPVFYLASLRGTQVDINFCGKNNLDLVIENRLFNMILHFIKPINQKTWMQHFIRIF